MSFRIALTLYATACLLVSMFAVIVWWPLALLVVAASILYFVHQAGRPIETFVAEDVNDA